MLLFSRGFPRHPQDSFLCVIATIPLVTKTMVQVGSHAAQNGSKYWNTHSDWFYRYTDHKNYKVLSNYTEISKESLGSWAKFSTGLDVLQWAPDGPLSDGAEKVKQSKLQSGRENSSMKRLLRKAARSMSHKPSKSWKHQAAASENSHMYQHICRGSDTTEIPGLRLWSMKYHPGRTADIKTVYNET